MHAHPPTSEDDRPRSQPGGATAEVVPIGYLRTAVVLLVLAHHSVLAYHAYAPPPQASLVDQPRWWQAFPVLDGQRSDLVALFAGWNDGFLMALLFFVSGLFVAGSIGRHGAAAFVARRLRRLGLPFIGMAAIIAPLAYYPAYLATEDPAGIAGYARTWLALGDWPAGPAWFLWMLLVFNVAAAAGFSAAPGWAARAARVAAGVTRRPWLFFVALLAMTAAAYLPMASIWHPLEWTTFGPFAFQNSRVLLYAVYFFAGIVVGAQGPGRGLLATDGELARRWWLWGTIASVAYSFAVVGAVMAGEAGGAGSTQTVANLGLVASCTASSVALLSLFLRFARRRGALADRLRANSYGLYVVHYAPVSWLQLALLGVALPALAKGTIVFVLTVLVSWGVTAALRQLPAVRRVL